MKLVNSLRAFLRYIRTNGKITNLNIAQIQYSQILSGKKIIVTGGSEGIGLCMAKKFVSLGAEVLITGRSIEKLKRAETDINSKNLHILSWDISDFNIIKSKLHESIRILGGLDILINNAAYIAHRKSDEDFYDKMMDTNLKSIYLACRYTVDYFLGKDDNLVKKILNISSITSFKEDTNPYSLSKRGVNALTKGFAKEYADKNIIVNAIAPGYVASSINYRDISNNAYDSRNRLHRIITPEEIAELAAFLCSDAANGIVGQVIACDGGVYITK